MVVDKNKCIGCATCTCCPVGAIKIVNGKSEIDPKKCIKCGTCAAVCPVQAISHK